jgi:hypothetical protein
MTPQDFYTAYPHLNMTPNSDWVPIEFTNVQNVSGYQNTITYFIKYANGKSQTAYAPSTANGWDDPNNPGRPLYFTFNVLTGSFIMPNPRAY